MMMMVEKNRKRDRSYLRGHMSSSSSSDETHQQEQTAQKETVKHIQFQLNNLLWPSIHLSSRQMLIIQNKAQKMHLREYAKIRTNKTI